MTRARWLAALGLLAAATASGKRPPARPDAGAPAPPARRVVIRITEEGEMTELRLDGPRLRVMTTVENIERERTVAPEERERIGAAARAVLAAAYSRRNCLEHETFVTLTVDGETIYTALCPTNRPEWVAEWRRLVELARSLAREAGK